MIYRNIRKVFKSTYFLLALSIVFIVFSIMIFLPNISLLKSIWFSDSFGLISKLSVTISLYGGIATNHTLLSAVYTIFIPILFGVNISLIVMYYKKVKEVSLGKEAKTSAFAVIISFLAVGCAACNTFLLTSILSLVGAAGIVALLPLGGQEFGLLAIMLLLYSTYITIKKLEEPLVCSM